MTKERIQSLDFREVVVFDDDVERMHLMQVNLESLGFRVTSTTSLGDVVDLARNFHRIVFVVDSRVHQKKQAGIDAIETIKSINKYTIAGLYSNYANNANKRMAVRVGADFFLEKSDNVARDMEIIATHIFRLIKQFAEEELDRIESFTQSVDEKFAPEIATQLESNIDKFNSLMSDSQWVDKNRNKFIAIVDGEFVGSHKKKQSLKNKIRKKYSGKLRLLTKVEDETEVHLSEVVSLD